MSKPEFVCDERIWNELSAEEQEYFLNWAEECGAERKVFFPRINPDYPDLMCIPHVSLGSVLTDDELLEFLELSEEENETIEKIVNDKPEPTDYMRRYINAYKNKGAWPGR